MLPCCLKNHQRICIQHLCSTTLRVCFTSLVPTAKLRTKKMHLKTFSIKQHDMFAINMDKQCNLINDLKWGTLKVQRIKSSLCIMYKIHHEFVNITLNEYMHLTINNDPYQNQLPSTNTRFYLSLLIKIPFHHSFSPRTILLWNSLSPNLIDQSSLDNFRNLLNDINFNNFMQIIVLFVTPYVQSSPL